MRPHSLLGCMLALACAPPPEDPIAFCTDGPIYRYAPSTEAYFTTFPDDFWTAADPATATGLRVALDPADTPGLDSFPENFVENFAFASELDGFGVTTPVVFQFDEDVSTRIAPEDTLLVARTADGDVDWPHTLSFEDLGQSVFIQPLVPLPEGTRIVAGVVGASPCLVPARVLRAQLTNPDHALGIDAAELGIDLAEVGALVGFTTQSGVEQDLLLADAIEGEAPVMRDISCEIDGDVRACVGLVEVPDFRGDGGYVPAGAPVVRGSYDLEVHIWAPLTTPEAAPVVMCGHGLAGSHSQCGFLRDRAVPLGAVVVAMDAVEHGAHPVQTPVGIDALDPLSIFAIEVPPSIHSVRLRDNFRMAAWDKLAVVEAVRAGVDLDEDGAADLDADRMAYVGASLGGIMGVQPAALSDAFKATVLIVGGGQITRIIQDSPTFSALIDVMAPPDWGSGDLARAFPILQMAVDAADPALWARHLTGDRLRDTIAPHVLLLIAKDDAVVPNSTNDVLARALDLPGLGAEIWPVEGIEFGATSVSANLPSGATGAVVQLDTVHIDGASRAAEHDNVHRSDEVLEMVEDLLIAVRDGTEPVLRAP